MENEKDLSDSEIESDLEEDIYINIWYIFFDLKKKSTTRIVVWARYLNLCELQIENK
jgi:hypothetical protein